MTLKQKAILDFIRAYQVRHTISPTVREIQTGIGCKSAGQISDALSRMESGGLITREPNKPRSIQLTAINDNPDHWVQVGQAALKLLSSIKEDIDAQGNGEVIVDAVALGELDVVVAEAMEAHHG